MLVGRYPYPNRPGNGNFRLQVSMVFCPLFNPTMHLFLVRHIEKATVPLYRVVNVFLFQVRYCTFFFSSPGLLMPRDSTPLCCGRQSQLVPYHDPSFHGLISCVFPPGGRISFHSFYTSRPVSGRDQFCSLVFFVYPLLNCLLGYTLCAGPLPLVLAVFFVQCNFPTDAFSLSEKPTLDFFLIPRYLFLLSSRPLTLFQPLR